MQIRSLDGLRRALAFVLWGALATTVDLWIGRTSTLHGGPPEGFRIDLVNDFIAALFVLTGLLRIRRAATGTLWNVALGFLIVVALVQSGIALLDHFVFERPPALNRAREAWDQATSVASVVFLIAMERLARTARFPLAARRWRRVWIGDLALLVLLFALALVAPERIQGPSSGWIAGTTAVAIVAFVSYGALFVMALFAASAMRTDAQGAPVLPEPASRPPMPSNP